MPTEKKVANVAELKDLVERSTIMIGAEYRGLTVKEMTSLRAQLRDAGVEARVVKNKLFQLAASQAGVEAAGAVADGPSLVIFGFGDIVAPSKAVNDYQKAARNAFEPKHVWMDGALSSGKVVSDLASLPSKDELLGKLVGAFVQPVQQLAVLLNDSIQSFARLAEARAVQLEGAGGGAAESAPSAVAVAEPPEAAPAAESAAPAAEAAEPADAAPPEEAAPADEAPADGGGGEEAT